MSDIIKRLRIKAGMIQMGERIEWGSDSGLMYEAADVIEQLMARDEQYTPADMADQGAQGWRDGYAWAKGEACSQAPAVQREPVGEVRLEFGTQSYVFAELYSKSLPVLAPGTKLYAAPQPTEHPPAPDVAGLVEALERLVGDAERATHVEFGGTPWLKEKMAEIDYARAALAAHRKQEPSHDNQ